MMKIVKKSLSKVAGAWCDIQNYLASKNQLDAHNLDFNCQRLEPRELLSATPVGSGVPDEIINNQTQIQEPLSYEDTLRRKERQHPGFNQKNEKLLQSVDQPVPPIVDHCSGCLDGETVATHMSF